MHRSPVTWLAAIALAIAAFVVPQTAAAQAAGGVGFRVDGGPGSTMDAGYITVAAGAGGSASGHFFMTNGGSETASLQIYPADGLTGVTTGVVYGSAGAPLAEAGAWIRPSLSSASLGPRSERRVDFSVTVPPSATPGDHVGAVVFEQKGKGSANVTQIVRHVAPIRIVVGSTPSAQIKLRSAKITALPGTALPAITVAMRNMGGRLCAPVLSVTLRGPSEKGAEVARQLDMILPGDRAPYPLPWPRSIEQGSYVARVVTTGCGASDAMTVTLEAPESFAPSTAQATPGDESTPAVNTNASPGESVYRDGRGRKTDAKPSRSPSVSKSGRDRGGSAADGAAGGAPGSGSSGSGGAGAGAGAGAGGGTGDTRGDGTSWVEDALDAVAENAPAVLKRASIPLLLLALVGLIFFVQEAIDRRDPKLALAPLHREPHVPFDPDPLHTRHVIPSPTALSLGP